METSAKKLQERKFYMALPALALPFITLLFWALGGGKVTESTAQQPAHSGLLLSLPDAVLKEDARLTKLDFYNQARADSLKLQELIRNDPNYQRVRPEAAPQTLNSSRGLNTSLNSDKRDEDANEEKIYRKLAQLEKELNTPSYSSYREIPAPYSPASTDSYSPEIDRLEEMMKTITSTESEQKEIEQLSGMLETILDIQHPERVQQRLTANRQEKESLPVSIKGDENTVSLLEKEQADQQGVNKVTVDSWDNDPPNGFFSWSESSKSQQVRNTIPAVIHETQRVVNGSTVKLRLTQDVTINGILLPKDNFVFGTAQLSGERLKIHIEDIRCEDSIYPIDLTVYDLDGMEGIYVRGAITRDAVKQSADRNIATLGISSLDPSLGAQAASAGIEVAKNLLSKKVKLIEVTLKAGYQVLLQNEKLAS